MLYPRQERFCEEYRIDFNGAQAAIRAGYSKRTATEQASRLLANVKVKERIKELAGEIKEQVEKKALITVEQLIEDIIGIKENCTPDKKYNATALKACELLGRHLGIFEKDNSQKPLADFTIIVNKE